ncbi:MAG TPA: 3-phosphoshikimate 1-carboxyvinyltransferase [Devosia sp.]|nr:3-phosphoshikimate 1-carboxyvinyltransferase [Devosia sp.]
MNDVSTSPNRFQVHTSAPLNGRFVTPGDLATAQGALLLAALTIGRSTIARLPDCAEIAALVTALRQLGAVITLDDGVARVNGLGTAGLLQADGPIALEELGAAGPLLLGMLAPLAMTTPLAGPVTLSAAERAALRHLVARLEDGPDGTQKLIGPTLSLPIKHRVAGDADKAMLLLAGLSSPGHALVLETTPGGDGLERLLVQFGADVETSPDAAGGTVVRLVGLPDLQPVDLPVAGDPSAASAVIVAALVVPGSDVVIENVLNLPQRTVLIDQLIAMGGHIQFINQRELGGEHITDLRVRASRLRGVRVEAAQAAAMLDDIPALAVAAAFAQGETLIEGLTAFRRQQPDRLTAIAQALVANGVAAADRGARLRIEGTGSVRGGGTVATGEDGALALSLLALGLGSAEPVWLDGPQAALASMVGVLNALGARIETQQGTQP